MRFTSKSEKKYWYYTLVVLIGIIGSIFLGRPLIDALPQHFASMGFAAVLWSVLGIIVLHGLVTKKHILEIALWIGIFSVYFLIVLRMTSEEERSHMIEFSILAICIYAALKERHQHAVLKYHPAIIAFAISVIIGALDEFIQLFVP
ncbi:MAG: VanZ family protein, partial [Bacteroidia bacterium]|nr:VanZ family protein [Bacteroidia bacterium]